MVLLTIGLMVGMVAYYSTGTISNAYDAQTIGKLNKIEDALSEYRAAYDRLPCPASLTVSEDDPSSGMPAENEGICTGGSPAATYATSANRVVEGAVPYQALGLPETFAFDGYGRRITYAVDVRMTGQGAFTQFDHFENCGAITVKDSLDADRTTRAVYALISYGPNGHGGFLGSGARFGAGSVNTDEYRNCNCDITPSFDGTYDATYVQADRTNLSTNTFDDVVRYKERWQMLSDADELLLPYVGPEFMVAHASSPYVTFYNKSCETITKAADPASLPGGTGQAASISPSNHYWAVGSAGSPYLDIYRRNGSSGAMTRLANPSTMPASGVSAVAFATGGLYFALADSTAPVMVYGVNTSTDVFTNLTGASGPQSQPTGAVSSLAFSPGDLYLAAGQDDATSRYMMVYKRSGNVFTALDMVTQMDTPPTGAVSGVAFSPSGEFMAVAHASSPRFSVYRVTSGTDSFTKLANPASLPAANATSVSFSEDGAYLAVTASNGTQSLYIYRIDPDAGTLTLVSGSGTSYNALAMAAFSPRQPLVYEAGSLSYPLGVMAYIPTQDEFTLYSSSIAPQPLGAASAVAARSRQ